jgi:hypothetical protein
MTNKRSERIRALAVCAMLASLGCVVLYLGSLIDVLDISMAVIASLFAVVAVIEYGGAAPWAVFALTGIISLIILPNKAPALMYAAFLGFYPIIKEKLERLRNKIFSWAFKEIIFNVCLVIMMAAAKYFLIPLDNMFVFEVIFFGLANVTFVLYDIALTRLISLYLFRIRKKFRIK